MENRTPLLGLEDLCITTMLYPQNWFREMESNHRPLNYRLSALPAELSRIKLVNLTNVLAGGVGFEPTSIRVNSAAHSPRLLPTNKWVLVCSGYHLLQITLAAFPKFYCMQAERRVLLLVERDCTILISTANSLHTKTHNLRAVLGPEKLSPFPFAR